MHKATKIVNFIGGPGVGKSTTALGVAYNLKKRRFSIEYVAEYAKDVTWDGAHALLENQTHIFAEQMRRQIRLLGKVDYVVTDSPLILSCVYHEYVKHKLPHPGYVEQVKAFFLASYQQFDNLTYLVEAGVRPYSPIGRNQTEVEARAVHEDVLKFMDANGLPYLRIRPEDAGVAQVLFDLGVPYG